MTIEEIEEVTDLIFGNGYDMLKTINKLYKKVKAKDKEIKRLKEENKKLKSYMQDTYDSINDMCSELQQRIDKAIKHIETHQLCYQSQYEEISGFDNHLLNILSGDE